MSRIVCGLRAEVGDVLLASQLMRLALRQALELGRAEHDFIGVELKQDLPRAILELDRNSRHGAQQSLGHWPDLRSDNSNLFTHPGTSADCGVSL